MASRDLINQLKAGGMSYSEIGRKLGRDSSLISQIARGKKQGKNLETSLEDIRDKRAVKEPERRVNKQTGKPQALRKSKSATPKGLLKDKKGRIKFAAESAREKVLLDRLDKIARDGGKVSFRVTYVDSDGEQRTAVLFGRGGMFAQSVFQELRYFGGTAFQWIAEKLSEQRGNGSSSSDLLDVDYVESVGINVVY